MNMYQLSKRDFHRSVCYVCV